ncbi:MAG TPA: molybdenum cofactor biosynthesis protein MoaE, partial [Thermoanaerobaculia bacterium]|nr:molybdenum cofactor biosynthesis protein MoaE [Thermoanaerobaculia bacterium]
MARVTRSPLDPAVLLAEARRDGDGGLTLFVGVVRDNADGRAVEAMEYEAYEPMAEKEMERIEGDLSARFPDVRLVMRHRIGRLAVGEVAVVVAASAPHREEAFAACRAGIEEIKARVPVWKREWGPDGSVWVDPCGAGHKH